MSSAEIKLDIIRLIDQIEDNDQLQIVYQRLLAVFESSVTNERLEESLDKALQQIAEGKVKSHEEVMKKYQGKFGR